LAVEAVLERHRHRELHFWVRSEYLVDVERRKINAATNNDLFDATADEEEASPTLVELAVALVARPEPSPAEGLVVGVLAPVVALTHIRTVQADLAALAGLELVAFAVADRHFGTGDWSADRGKVAPGQPVVPLLVR